MARNPKHRKVRQTATPADGAESRSVSIGRTDRRAVITAASLAMFVVHAYLPAFRAGYIWDDNDHLPLSELQQSMIGLKLVWTQLGATPQYYPLTHTTFWIESQIWGLDPTGYHVVNVLLHASSTVLLWRILRRLNVPGALLAAAIFGLHPVHVESVAWVSERKNVLSGFFYLAAGLCYLRAAGFHNASDEAPLSPDAARLQPHGRLAWTHYALAIVLFCCAVLSKTVTSSLPAALCVVLWWQRRLDKRQILLLLPMFAIGIAMGSVTAGMERWSIGAVGKHWDWTFVERTLIAGRAAWFYAAKLVWPETLIFVYPRWQIDTSRWWQFLFPLGVLVLLGTSMRLCRKVGRGPLAALLFFGGTLFPALGFVNVYPMRFSFVADHFQYLASIGLIALVVAAVITLWRRYASLRLGQFVGGTLLLLLGVLTWRQTLHFRDAETLWRHTLDRNPYAWMVHTNLGAILGDRGDLHAASRHFQESLRLEPEQAQTQLIWGGLLKRQGDLAAAEALFRDARKQEPSDVAPAYELGSLLLAKKDVAGAIAEWESALAIDPRHEGARLDLANLLATTGRVPEAMDHFQQALDRNPYSLEARQRAATVLTQIGQPDQALGILLEGLDLGGSLNAAYRNNVGVAFLRLGRPADARAHFVAAINRQPGFVPAIHNLGAACESLGDLSGAAQYYREALRLQSDYQPSLVALARLSAPQR